MWDKQLLTDIATGSGGNSPDIDRGRKAEQCLGLTHWAFMDQPIHPRGEVLTAAEKIRQRLPTRKSRGGIRLVTAAPTARSKRSQPSGLSSISG
jgi:hypothetical protein